MINRNIWTRILTSTEEIKYEFSIGKRYLKIRLIAGCALGVILLFLIPLLGLILILIFYFYYGFYLKKANRYVFTNKRALICKGWLSTKLISIDYNKITDIEVQEPFFEKLFYKTGTISLNTAGTTLKEVILERVESPYKIKKKLYALKDKNQKIASGRFLNKPSPPRLTQRGRRF